MAQYTKEFYTLAVGNSNYKSLINGGSYTLSGSAFISSVDMSSSLIVADIPNNATILNASIVFTASQNRTTSNSLYQSYARFTPYALNSYTINGDTYSYSGSHSLSSTLLSDRIGQSESEHSIDITQYISKVSDLTNGIRLAQGAKFDTTLPLDVTISKIRIKVTYVIPEYYLDLNCYVNGTHAGDISTVGTANVYINGSLVSENCTDYYVQHPVGTTYQIDVTANTGWKISGFNTNPVSFSGTINGTTNVEPEFSKIQCTVSVSGTGGSVTGSGTYDYGTQVTLKATPNVGYRFVRWSDGNTNQTRTVTVTSDVTYTAVFEKLKHTVNLSAGEGGSVTGGGTYDYGTSVTIKAVPNTGYHFVRWSDGNISQTRTLTVTANVSLTAYFEADKINKIYLGSTNANVYIGSTKAGSVSVGDTKVYG